MNGPLDGVVVVELAGIGPGPHCGMLLADLGADVIRVERPGDGGGLAEITGHRIMNRGKRSIAVDLKRAEGVEVVLRLVGSADVLIEGFRPGVMERLGLGPAECLARNPALVYGRITGWGQEGPLAATAGHDIDYLAVAGALGAIGTPDKPVPPLNLVGDFGGGSLYLAVGVMAGLLAARSTGKGQVVDAAMVDGVAHLSAMMHGAIAAGFWGPERRSNLLDGGAPFYDTYETADGRHVAVGALEPQFYAALLAGLGIDSSDLAAQHDRSGWPEMRRRFAEVFRTRTRDEWEEIFSGSDACVAPVLGLSEAPHHPHMVDRFLDVDGVVQPGPAPRFEGTPPAPLRRPPVHGEHTDEVLEWLGLDADELRARSAVE